PHRLSRSSEEMAAAFPVPDLLHIDQPQVGLVDQGRGLERLARLLLSQPLDREPAQLVVDQRQQLLRGVRIALLHGGQDRRDLIHWHHRKARRNRRTSSPYSKTRFRNL